jgi:hypothetical protein
MPVLFLNCQYFFLSFQVVAVEDANVSFTHFDTEKNESKACHHCVGNDFQIFPDTYSFQRHSDEEDVNRK